MTSQIKIFDHPRIIVARTDRIGDVALSLPVFASIRKAYPDAHIACLTRSYTRDLLAGRGDVDEIVEFDAPTAHVPWNQFSSLRKRIADKNFDIAIALFSNFSVASLLAAAKVPVRIGPASKLAQFFLTHKVKQRRSKKLRHETDHNLDLLGPLGIEPVRDGSIPVSESANFRGDRYKGVVGIHPGHGGSSKNWPIQNYAKLIEKLVSANYHVVVTASPDEKVLIEKNFPMATEGGDVTTYIGSNGLREFFAILKSFDLFVASSTGPLHLASGVGTPAIGIYSPVFVCLPERWGPIGENDIAIRPEVLPCKKCINEECPEFDCMEKISVDQVFKQAMRLMTNKNVA